MCVLESSLDNHISDDFYSVNSNEVEDEVKAEPKVDMWALILEQTKDFKVNKEQGKEEAKEEVKEEVKTRKERKVVKPKRKCLSQ